MKTVYPALFTAAISAVILTGCTGTSALNGEGTAVEKEISSEESYFTYEPAVSKETAENTEAGSSDAETPETGSAELPAPESPEEWLKRHIWEIIGNENLFAIPEVRDFLNPQSARLYKADMDGDGTAELLHCLNTRTYTTIVSVYKPRGTEFEFIGYYYDYPASSHDEPYIGKFEKDGETRLFCKRMFSSGSQGQPCWTELYEVKLKDTVELIPVISDEWAYAAYDSDELVFSCAEHDGVYIYDEEEYDAWLEDYFRGWTKQGDIAEITDSIEVPFSPGFQNIFPEKKLQEIIDWICDEILPTYE